MGELFLLIYLNLVNMKKLLTNSIVVFFLIQDLAYADLGDTTVYAPQSVEVNPLYASPISSGQNSGKYTIINSELTPFFKIFFPSKFITYRSF
jgi:hypothetical protein